MISDRKIMRTFNKVLNMYRYIECTSFGHEDGLLRPHILKELNGLMLQMRTDFNIVRIQPDDLQLSEVKKT